MAQQRNVALEAAVDRLTQFVPGRPRVSGSPQHVAEIAITQFAAMQKPRELSGLLKIVGAEAPKTIVEIGTARGGTLFALSQMVPSDASLISIDRPAGAGGGGYRAREEFEFASRRVKGQTMNFLRADSHYTGGDPYSTESRLHNLLKGREIDLLFIDGDHSYKGVRQDFETYSGLVAVGGLIAMHDIAPNPEDPTIEVSTFWEELKAENAYSEFREFVHAQASHGMPEQGAGIGLIRI